MNRKEHFPQGFNNWNVCRDAWKEILTHRPQHTHPLGGDGGLPAWMGRGTSTPPPNPWIPAVTFFCTWAKSKFLSWPLTPVWPFSPLPPSPQPCHVALCPATRPFGVPGRPFLLLGSALPHPAEAPYFIASNFTFFCFSLTRPRALTSFPYPLQLVRISPRW